jgi:hypothetical protein
MTRDRLLDLQVRVTKTASFNSATFDFGAISGSGRRGGGVYFAEILYKAAADAAAPVNSTATFKIQHSDDDGTWYDLTSGASDVLTLTATALNGRILLPVSTDKRYIRLVLTIANGDGSSTPTITYTASLGFSKP